MNKVQGGNNLTNRGRGRPKGSRNKTTMAAKEVIEKAAERLGGATRMVEWAQEAPENEKAFWSIIYPKLLPLQVDASVSLTLSESAMKWLGRSS